MSFNVWQNFKDAIYTGQHDSLSVAKWVKMTPAMGEVLEAAARELDMSEAAIMRQAFTEFISRKAQGVSDG